MGELASGAIQPRSGSDVSSAHRFGRGSDGNALLKSGWGEPEDGFVWTEGRASSLLVPVFSGRNRIVLSVWGYAPAECPSQDVMLFVDGAMKGFFNVSDQTLMSVSFENASADRDVEVLLYIPTAISPKKAEGNPDYRQLGIALSVIEISGSKPMASEALSRPKSTFART